MVRVQDLLVLRALEPEELPVVCCICGCERRWPDYFPTGVLLEDGRQENPRPILCMSCAAAYWHEYLLPEDEVVLRALRYHYAMEATFFGDSMSVYNVLVGADDLWECIKTLKLIFQVPHAQNPACAIAALNLEDKTGYLLVLDLGDDHVWFLPGSYMDLEVFLISMRWAFYLIHRPKPDLSIRVHVTSSDAHPFQRYEIVMTSGKLDTKAWKIVHYGHSVSRTYASMGAKFLLEWRWGMKVHSEQQWSTRAPWPVSRAMLEEEILRVVKHYDHLASLLTSKT